MDIRATWTKLTSNQKAGVIIGLATALMFSSCCVCSGFLGLARFLGGKGDKADKAEPGVSAGDSSGSTEPRVSNTPRAESKVAETKANTSSRAYKEGYANGQKFGSQMAAIARQTGQTITEEEIRDVTDAESIEAQTGTHEIPYDKGTSDRTDWVAGYQSGYRNAVK